MNVQAIYHQPESNFCFALDSTHVTLRLRFASGEKLQGVFVLYNTKYHIAQRQFKQQMTFRCTDGAYDYYQTTLSLHDPRLAYVFLVQYQDKSGYFCEDGLLDDYDFNYAYFNSFQYAYVNNADVHHNVEWLNNAVFYQIFIDRFAKGNTAKDASYVNADWGDKPHPKSFFGGDLVGITQNLPYVKALGASALYLTPIFCSKSNHKYDITDYFNVDPMFGSNEDFANLVKACHAMGIKVVLDGVFNHTSEDFAPFVDVAQNGNKSPYFEWFVVNGNKIDKANHNYEMFAECDYMPKLNTSNPDVQKFIQKVALYWIEQYDIDGWRLDVSDEVSHDCWRQLRRAVKQAKPTAVLIGENWHNSQSYLNGDQFDGIMNYAFTKQMMDFFCHGKSAQSVANNLNAQLMRYTDIANNMMFNLLDSHDTHRFLSLCGDKGKLLCALALSVFMQGGCSVYYGTEALVTGGYDPDCRKGFPWDKINQKDVAEFLTEVKKLLALKQQPAMKGEIKIYCKGDNLIVERVCDSQTLVLTASVKGLNLSTCKPLNVLIQQNLFTVERR